MTKTTGHPKRWRPRFSLRTLVLFVTLVGVYFGAWEATKKFGVPAVSSFAEWDGSEFPDLAPYNAHAPYPFYVRISQKPWVGGSADVEFALTSLTVGVFA